jgi:RecJ-like exonuclease
MSSDTADMFRTAEKIANRFNEEAFDKVIIISHIDADGLTAAGIASIALRRKDFNHEIKFVKQLDDTVIKDLEALQNKSSGKEKLLFWFTDLGSGMGKEISKFKPIITDHHAPSISDFEVPVSARTDLLQFSDVLTHQVEEFHLNPHLFNLDGTYDISGAGTVYLVARAIAPENIDLAYLAVIGAVGDLQDSRFRQLIGTNRKILADAEASGKIKIVTDFCAFGRETRALHNVLRYSTDPYLPGLTLNEANCIRFLKGLNISLKSNGQNRRWVELDDSERRTILSALMELMLSKGIGNKDAKRLFSEVYLLSDETTGTELHDAKEFATLLNSCGKYNKPEIGHEICLGNREESLNKAFQLLKDHKNILVRGLNYVKEHGIEEHGIIQFFDAGDKIPENIVGTVANMLLSNEIADNSKPIFGFATVEDGSGIKVSGRTTEALVKSGVNLSVVMSQVSDELGGGSVGGGHDIAAGATIPLDTMNEFVKRADEIIRTQIGT